MLLSEKPSLPRTAISMLPITCDEAPLEILPKALAAAHRALEPDDSPAEAHASLGTVKVWMDWDRPGAETSLRRALEINPGSVQAHRFYACLLSHKGRHAEAAAEMRKLTIRLPRPSSGCTGDEPRPLDYSRICGVGA